MATPRNPNPAHITEALWGFWLAFKAIEPSVVLAGIYGNKPGYHNSRAGNTRWDYSVLSTIDKKGSALMGAGIDLTFPSAQRGDFRTIAKYSARLLKSGRDLLDERGNYLRSFYGNADLDRAVEGWDFQAVVPVSSDATHLWHIHLSFSRGYVADPKAMRAVLSILKGETVKAWRVAEAVRLIKPKPKPPPKPTPPPAPTHVVVPPPVAEAPPAPGRAPAPPPAPIVAHVEPAPGSVPEVPAATGWRVFTGWLREALSRPTK